MGDAPLHLVLMEVQNLRKPLVLSVAAGSRPTERVILPLDPSRRDSGSL